MKDRAIGCRYRVGRKGFSEEMTLLRNRVHYWDTWLREMNFIRVLKRKTNIAGASLPRLEMLGESNRC